MVRLAMPLEALGQPEALALPEPPPAAEREVLER
jgi:hypothetical protein